MYEVEIENLVELEVHLKDGGVYAFAGSIRGLDFQLHKTGTYNISARGDDGVWWITASFKTLGEAIAWILTNTGVFKRP